MNFSDGIGVAACKHNPIGTANIRIFGPNYLRISDTQDPDLSANEPRIIMQTQPANIAQGPTLSANKKIQASVKAATGN